MRTVAQTIVFDRFETAETIWRTFESTAYMYPFQAFDFCRTWFDTVGIESKVRPHIVAIIDDQSRPVLLAPLCVVPHWSGAQALTFMGGTLTDYNAPMIASDYKHRIKNGDSTDVPSLILEHSPDVDCVLFDKQPVTIKGISNPFLTSSAVAMSHGSFGVTLPEDFKTYCQTQYKPRIRKDTQRQNKRLHAMGRVSITRDSTTEERTQIVNAMIEHKSRRYRQTRARDIFAQQGHRDFFHRMALLPASPSLRVEIAALKLDDAIIATHVGYSDRSRFYYIMPTYSSGPAASLSPGRILLIELLKDAIDRKLSYFDFTIGDEAYKKDWCDTEAQLYHTFIRRNLRGSLAIKAETTLLKMRRNERLRSFVRWMKQKVRAYPHDRCQGAG